MWTMPSAVPFQGNNSRVYLQTPSLSDGQTGDSSPEGGMDHLNEPASHAALPPTGDGFSQYSQRALSSHEPIEPIPTQNLPENKTPNGPTQPQHPVLTASFQSPFTSPPFSYPAMQYHPPQGYVQNSGWYVPPNSQELQMLQTSPLPQPQTQPAVATAGMQQVPSQMLQAPNMMMQMQQQHMQQHMQMPQVHDGIHAGTLNFGLIVYDLETTHDAERGNYAEKGIHECSQDEQIEWKSRSQIIEFAAVDVLTGESICVRSRPEFNWEDVKSHAARLFAEDHGHADIIRDQNLPYFAEVWAQEVLPFLWRASGNSRQLAMLAHNGDAFDHYVLQKEIKRLNLPTEGGPALVGFDPVTVLKQNYGHSFGSGGLLALRQLYQQHVPSNRVLRAHQAMDDCVMLMEVIQHWHDLNMLLAHEIATQMGHKVPGSTEAQVQQAVEMLRYRLTEPVRILPAPAQAQISIYNGHRMFCSPQAQAQSLADREPRMEMGQGISAYPNMIWQPQHMDPNEMVHMPRAEAPQVVLLSTVTCAQPPVHLQRLDDGPMIRSPPSEERLRTSSSESEMLMHMEPPPPPADPPPTGNAVVAEASYGRSVSELEAELHRAQKESSSPDEKPKARRGFPIGKDGTKREIRESEEYGHHRGRNKKENEWSEWERRKSWDRNDRNDRADRREDWWTWDTWGEEWEDWENWENWEQPNSKHREKKKKNRKRKEWQSKEKEESHGSSSEDHTAAPAQAAAAQGQAADAPNGGRRRGRHGRGQGGSQNDGRKMSDSGHGTDSGPTGGSGKHGRQGRGGNEGGSEGPNTTKQGHATNDGHRTPDQGGASHEGRRTPEQGTWVEAGSGKTGRQGREGRGSGQGAGQGAGQGKNGGGGGGGSAGTQGVYYGYGYDGYYNGYAEGRGPDWNWRNGYWGMVPAPYVAFWGKGKGSGRGDKNFYWSGAAGGYYNDYPQPESHGQAQHSQSNNRPPPKPVVSKTTEDLGTLRWQ